MITDIVIILYIVIGSFMLFLTLKKNKKLPSWDVLRNHIRTTILPYLIPSAIMIMMRLFFHKNTQLSTYNFFTAIIILTAFIPSVVLFLEERTK